MKAICAREFLRLHCDLSPELCSWGNGLYIRVNIREEKMREFKHT
jgi:hypothetical protein